MPEKIRLACCQCDTDSCDGVDEIPADWSDVQFVQSLEESQREVAAGDQTRSVTQWFTHLGICPECRDVDD